MIVSVIAATASAIRPNTNCTTTSSTASPAASTRRRRADRRRRRSRRRSGSGRRRGSRRRPSPSIIVSTAAADSTGVGDDSTDAGRVGTGPAVDSSAVHPPPAVLPHQRVRRRAPLLDRELVAVDDDLDVPDRHVPPVAPLTSTRPRSAPPARRHPRVPGPRSSSSCSNTSAARRVGGIHGGDRALHAQRPPQVSGDHRPRSTPGTRPPPDERRPPSVVLALGAGSSDATGSSRAAAAAVDASNGGSVVDDVAGWQAASAVDDVRRGPATPCAVTHQDGQRRRR